VESNPKEVRYCPKQAAPWVYTTLSLWLMMVCSLQFQVHSSSPLSLQFQVCRAIVKLFSLSCCGHLAVLCWTHSLWYS